MTPAATKTLDWGDDTFGFQQEHGTRDLSSTHNIVRFHPAPGGGVEIAFGTTAYFCGGTVVHRADGSIMLSAEQRAELARLLGPGAPFAWAKPDEIAGLREYQKKNDHAVRGYGRIYAEQYEPDMVRVFTASAGGLHADDAERLARVRKLVDEWTTPDPEAAHVDSLRALVRVLRRELGDE